MDRKELLQRCDEIVEALDGRDPKWRELAASLGQAFGYPDLHELFIGDQTAAYVADRLRFADAYRARTPDDLDLERLVAMVRYSLGTEAEVDGADDVLKRVLRTPQLDALLGDPEISPRAVVRIARTGAGMAVPLPAANAVEE